MFVSDSLGKKYTCPHCTTSEQKVMFYDLGKEGNPTCPNCGQSHNPIEHLRLKSYYQGMEEEVIEDGGDGNMESDDTAVLEDTSELTGDEAIPDAPLDEKSDH